MVAMLTPPLLYDVDGARPVNILYGCNGYALIDMIAYSLFIMAILKIVDGTLNGVQMYNVQTTHLFVIAIYDLQI